MKMPIEGKYARCSAIKSGKGTKPEEIEIVAKNQTTQAAMHAMRASSLNRRHPQTDKPNIPANTKIDLSTGHSNMEVLRGHAGSRLSPVGTNSRRR